MQTGAERIHAIVLANDEPDDRLFFSDGLSAISGAARLLVVESGMELMLILHRYDKLVQTPIEKFILQS